MDHFPFEPISSMIKSEITCPEFTSRFQVQSILGSGAFSSVFCVKQRSNGSIVAIKILKQRSTTTTTTIITNECSNANDSSNNNKCDKSHKSASFKNMVRKEIDIHTLISSYNHPHIVKVLESFEYNTNDISSASKLVHAIVLEYCELGTLQQYLKRVRDDTICGKTGQNRFTFLPEEEVRFALRQLFRALSMIHAHAIVHRDIKPENILLAASNSKAFVDRQRFSLMDCVLKLSDFGLAVKMKDDDDWNNGQNGLCGTLATMAPEVFMTGKQTRSRSKLGIVDKYQSVVGYGQPADLWSTGVIQYLMLVGRFPFISSKPSKPESFQKDKERFHIIKNAMKEVVEGKLVLPSNILISQSGNYLLHQLLNKNPQHRGFARGILSTHPFFSEDYVPYSYSNQDDSKTSGENIKRQKRVKSDTNSYPLLTNYGEEETINTSEGYHQSISTRNSVFEAVLVPDVLPMKFQFYKDIDELHTYEYTIFILPNNYGAVIQASKLTISPPIEAEDIPICFVWCHLVQSGKWYSFHQFEDERNDIECDCIMTDAFANGPQDDFWQSGALERNLDYLKDLDNCVCDSVDDFKRWNYDPVSKASLEEILLLEILYDTLTALTEDIDTNISMVILLKDKQHLCTASLECSIQRSTKIVQALFEDYVKVIYSIYEQEGCLFEKDEFIGAFSYSIFSGTVAPNDPLHNFSNYFSFVHNIIIKLIELYQHEICLRNAQTKSGIDSHHNQRDREYRCVVKGTSLDDWVIESN